MLFLTLNVILQRLTSVLFNAVTRKFFAKLLMNNAFLKHQLYVVENHDANNYLYFCISL